MGVLTPTAQSTARMVFFLNTMSVLTPTKYRTQVFLSEYYGCTHTYNVQLVSFAL